MAMEAAHLHHDFFLSPSPPHLAELRIEPPHSAVAFSAPCPVAGGCKRRCLLPAVSPRKKMLIELHPFDSSPAPTPPPSPRGSPITAPPLLSRGGSPASDFSFPSACPWIGGGGGGNIFAFENTPTTPSPTGSNVSTLSFTASPGQPTTPTGVNASAGVTLVTSPEKPTAGPTANGGFMFTASPEQPLTPASSTAGGGFASLSSEPSLSPREYHGRAVASLLSPKHAHTGSTDSGGLAFFPSPGPAVGHTSSPTSPAFIFSASRTSAPPVRKPGDSSKKRPRRQHGIVSRRSLRQWDLPQQAIQLTHTLVTGEASRSSILSGSSARPCCRFFTSPAKASKQEARKASSEESRSTSPCGSPAGSRCTFVPSPVEHRSAEKASKQDREVEVSSLAREGATTDAEPGGCTCAPVVVRVTCTCGVRKEFCFDRCH